MEAGLCALPFKNLLIKVNIIFKVGMVLNTMALLTASKQSSRTDIRSRTNVHYLVFHLTVADTITCFITMPMETAWRLFIGVNIYYTLIPSFISQKVTKLVQQKIYYLTPNAFKHEHLKAGALPC